MSDVLDYAKLASHVYDDGSAATHSLAGWQRRFDHANTASGFYAAVYARPNAHEFVLAFRGTNPGEMGDLIADYGIVKKRLTQQFADAVNAYHSYRRYLTDRCGPAAVITGHSLGGALAKFVGAVYGHTVHAFNAPGIDGLGGMTSRRSTGDLRNVNAMFDPVSRFGDTMGRTERIMVNSIPLVPDAIEPLFAGVPYLLSQHSMDNLVDALARLSPSRRPFAHG
ncbi:MAG: hypothetical protein HKM95_18035 [Inquilinus sp.]|nr:hypothetical protein [Inquilinus sp.]